MDKEACYAQAQMGRRWRDAAKNGQIEVASLLMERGARVDATDVEDMTALHRAAENGHLEMAQWLVERGVLVDATDRCGETALHKAVRGGYIEIVEWLVEQGARLDAIDKNRATVLQMAAHGGHVEMTAWLVERGTRLDTTDQDGMVLHAAAGGGHVEMAAWLVDRGARLSHGTNRHGWTLLHAAAIGGHTEMAAWLLDQGVPIDAIDGRHQRGGRTALHWAVMTYRRGTETLWALLVGRGASLDVRDESGTTVLSLALSSGRIIYRSSLLILVYPMASQGMPLTLVHGEDTKPTRRHFRVGRQNDMRAAMAARRLHAQVMFLPEQTKDASYQ